MPLNKDTKPFKCPLCGDTTKLKEKLHHGDKPTYVWSCPSCPFVAMEYYGHNDLLNLSSLLEGGERVDVDLRKLADEMVSCDIEPQMIRDGDFDGWSDVLLDSLERLYGIETGVREIIEKL